MRLNLTRVLIAFALLVAFPFAAEADRWGERLPDQPTQFIFGYGSLINSPSRNETAVKPIPAIPVRVSASFGYVRGWVIRASSGFTALGLRRPDPGESATTINGVLYPAEGEDMSRFDARERGYRRIEVPRAMMEAVSWQQLPPTGQIWVYVPVGPSGEPGVGLERPSADFPVVQSYVDVVLQGALEYGEDFAREVIETTRDWDPFWLNDREIARRPWVANKQAGIIDRLLRATPPAAESFRNRLFAEPYAARHLLQRERPPAPAPVPSPAPEPAPAPG